MTKDTKDTRKSYYPHELSDRQKLLFEEGFKGRETPELDHLLKDDEQSASGNKRTSA